MKPFTEDLKFTFDGLTADSICADAGAHEGNWGHEMWRRYGCKIIALEPIPRYIHETFLRLANTNATIIPLALGGFSCVDSFAVHGAMSGAFADGSPQTVGSIALETLMEYEGLSAIDVLKLNVEGQEFDILEHALSRGLIGRIKNIIVQPHTCVPDFESRWKAIQEGLAKTHECVWAEPWCWEGYKLSK